MSDYNNNSRDNRQFSTSSMVSNPMRIAEEIQLSVLNEQKKATKPTSSQFTNINDLSHWFEKYGAQSDILLQNNIVDTFLDHNGIRRYKDTWQIYEDPNHKLQTYQGVKELYLQTGCIHKDIRCQFIIEQEEINEEQTDGEKIEGNSEIKLQLSPRNQSLATKNLGLTQENLKNIATNQTNNISTNTPTNSPTTTTNMISTHFLNDWEKLWSYFEQDNDDEIANQAMFFKQFVEFYCHPRTAQLMLFVCVYNTMIFLAMTFIFPGTTLFVVIYRLFSNALNFYVYLICACLFKGNFRRLYSTNKSTSSLVSNPTTDINANLNNSTSTSHYSFRYLSILKQMFHETWQECVHICYEGLGYQTTSNSLPTSHSSPPPETTSSSTSASSSSTSASSFTDKIYKLSYYDLMNLSLKFLVRHNRINMQTIRFNRNTYRFALIFTFIGFPLYIFFNSFADVFYNVLPNVCSKTMYDPICEYYLFYVGVSFGLLTFYLQNVIFGATVLLALIGLAYGGEISYRLTNTWIRKFACLRRIQSDKLCSIVPIEGLNDEKNELLNRNLLVSSNNLVKKTKKASVPIIFDDNEDNDDDSSSGSSEESYSRTKKQEEENQEYTSTQWSLIDTTLLNNDLSNLLSQDAIESYLFIKHFLLQADKIWSPMLTGLFLLNVYIITTSFVYIKFYGQTITSFLKLRILIIAMVRTLVLVIYPIMSISHANAYISELKSTFINSSTYDFQLIGGRNKWIRFIDSCPLVWTYYGVWITWDRLTGVLWTGFVAIIAFVVTLIQNNS